MAFSFTTENPKIELEPQVVEKVNFNVEIPLDSSARTKDVGITLTVYGKILANTKEPGSAMDSTSKLLDWSHVPAESKESFRSVVVKDQVGSAITRQYELPNAFIVSYQENFDPVDGSGKFTLVLRQMKQHLEDAKVSGGFSA